MSSSIFCGLLLAYLNVLQLFATSKKCVFVDYLFVYSFSASVPDPLAHNVPVKIQEIAIVCIFHIYIVSSFLF